MANLTPKIEYGSPTTTIEFDIPPESFDNEGKTTRVEAKVSSSQNGEQQISLNHIKEEYKVKFKWVSKSIRDAVETMITTHASLNKTFTYFFDKDDVTGIEVLLDKRSLKFKSKRLNTQDLYEFQITFFRVTG